MAACARHGAAVVPQGGNTGLVGASVPRGGEVVISLSRLNADRARSTPPSVRSPSAPGRPWRRSRTPPARTGEDAALDFAARDSCTVGGVVACDAGGARALRYGTARAHVAGLEAVLADGSVVSRLAGLSKDNAGYDLPALLVGSEGTLGVITRVRWQLAADPAPSASPRSCRCSSAREAARLLRGAAARSALAGELRLLPRRGPSSSCSSTSAASRRCARARPLYVLAECAGRTDPTEELAEALEQRRRSTTRSWPTTPPAARACGRCAKGTPMRSTRPGSRTSWTSGCRWASSTGSWSEVPGRPSHGAGGERVILFGHLGDGNVHVNVLGRRGPDDLRVDDAVLELVLSCGGTISAEHGVGVAKARWLERARGAAEVAAMRAIKEALDPQELLNPGAVLPMTRTAR